MTRFQALNVSDSGIAPLVGQAAAPRTRAISSADVPPRRGLLRVEEAALWLGLSKRTMYELLSRGDVQSVQIGRSRRIALVALEQYVDRLSNGLG